MENPYKEVRGLSRGLDLLKALNGQPGGLATTSLLARLCGLDRTTTKRLLETLRAHALVRPGERDGQYQLTFEVRRLAEGFADERWVEQVVAPTMRAAARDLVWPCDFATPQAGFMIVRESTHRYSALSQHRAMVGERIPILVSALGRAYLTACGHDEREAMLELIARRQDPGAALALDRAAVRRLVAATRRRGHALNEGEWQLQAAFAAIGIPVMVGVRPIGALNLVFPLNAVGANDLRRRYLPALQALANQIGEGLRRLEEVPTGQESSG